MDNKDEGIGKKITYNEMLSDARYLARQLGVTIRRANKNIEGKAAYEFVHIISKEKIRLGRSDAWTLSMAYENIAGDNLENAVREIDKGQYQFTKPWYQLVK